MRIETTPSCRAVLTQPHAVGVREADTERDVPQRVKSRAVRRRMCFTQDSGVRNSCGLLCFLAPCSRTRSRVHPLFASGVPTGVRCRALCA